MLRLADAGLRPIAARLNAARLCKRKYRHSTRGAAEAALRSLIGRELHRPELGTLNVYRCPRCLAWHVGHRREKGELV
jgi:hypothetical protein